MTVPNAPAPVCYRHPDRVSYVRCTRCDRTVCGDCMRSAAVGQQCVDCVRADAKAVRRPRLRPSRAVVSYALIAVNVLVFGLQSSSAGLNRALVLWSPAVAGGEFYRLATSAFVHYGLLHLLVNMWALYVVGPELEAALGRWRFGALYALSALGGSTAVFALAPVGTATAGASGAVFGLFGATFVMAKHLRMDVGWVAAVIIINLVFSFSVPNISWQGHLGGLVTGSLVAWAYLAAHGRREALAQAGLTLVALAVLAVLVGWRAGVLAAELGLS